MSGAGLSSEHWYRVAGLRPRLRADVERHVHRYRGRRWILLRDPVAERFLRVYDTAWAFVSLLDGEHTTEQALAKANESFGELRITQPEAVDLLAWLHRHHFLRSGSDADARRLDQLREQIADGRAGQRLAQVLTPRISLWNPDPWLDRVVPALAPAFGRKGALAWLGLVALGATAVLSRLDDWWAGGRALLDPDPRALLGLAVAFVAVKAAHELAHGVACKYYGRRAGLDGAVRSMGVLLIALFPVPYVDASSSWALPRKRERIAIALAGMVVELALAAVAAIVWAATGPGLVHTVAHHVTLVAGVTTVLVNANPLLRFDAYYALSDLLEIPNLASRSREAWTVLARRHGVGVRGLTPPWFSRAECAWLLAYGLASTIYRALVLVAILFLLAGRAFFVGAALALLGLWVWFGRPLFQLVRYLATSREAAPTRGRALATATLGSALALLVLFALPLPERERVEGVIEPRELAWIFLRDEGFLVEALPPGALVHPDGAPVIQLRNPELEIRLRQVEADTAATQVRLREAIGQEPARVRYLQEDLEVLEARRARLAERAAALRVQAPIAGTWIPRSLDERVGAFLRADGERPLGLVADFDAFVVRVVADQEVGPRLIERTHEGSPVRVRLHSRPWQTVSGELERVVPSGQGALPSPALARAAGGAVDTRASDPQGTEAAEPFFELRVKPVGDGLDLARSGERVSVQFDLGASPLGVRWWRALRQLVQRRLPV